jgi:DNA-binding transcriptional LysR family regulator
MGISILRDTPLLRHFLAVATEGSISAACTRLAVTQPALTKSIQRLEAQLGVTLFERLPRGMALTPYGHTLLPHARRIEAECRFAEVEMQAFRGGRTGRLRVGAGPDFGAALVPGAIARLQERYPKLDVEIMVGVNDVILPRLFDGALDLAFCRLPAEDALPPFIDRRPFFEIESRVVAGAGHPLLTASRVAAKDLAAFPWAIYQQDREIVGHLFAMMRDEGAKPPRIAAEVNSLTALIQMLKAGRYLSCMAEALVDAYPELGLAVVPFARPILRFLTGALIHRSLERHAPARLLHELVREHAGRLRRR